MMKLLVPLGLIGLLGIVALIIIYIIKPNYLVQHTSSNYVWKLSLKYRKRRLPTSRIRNILIFLCQLLSLALIAGILAMPVIEHNNRTNKTDIIAVIDSSASMYVQSEGVTRFERAVSEVTALSRDVFAQGGYMSVIIADNEPHFLAREVPLQNSASLYNALNELRDDPRACYYGISDVEGAMKLCEDILNDNPAAEIHFYTDTTYQYVPDGISVINVSEGDEWNAGILTATAEIEDVYDVLTVQVASYGKSTEVSVNIEVYGANAANSSEAGSRISLTQQLTCNADVVYSVIFKYFSSGTPEMEDNVIYYSLGLNERFQSFQSIHVSIETLGGSMGDCFSADDSFDIYGGQKELLKVQYASSRKIPNGDFDPNNPGLNRFVNGALGMVKNAMSDRYDIAITEVSPGKEPALEGFDLYIFEHDMPERLPTDGVVFLLDPNIGWSGAGIEVMKMQDMNKVRVYLMENDAQSEHPVLKNPNGYKVIADNITVTRYKVLSYDTESYDVLMTCDTDPVLLVKKDRAEQVAIMSFSVHFSNLPNLLEMPFLFYNLFDYYFPGSVNKYAFEVGESIAINSRGESATFSYQEEPITDFPAYIPLYVPGTYTVRQTTYYAKTITSEIFVKVPAWESNIRRVEDSLVAPHRDRVQDSIFDDLLIYLAAGLVFLLFTEWILQAQERK